MPSPETEQVAYKFTVTGTEQASGTMVRTFVQQAVIEAESAGEALRILNERVLEWDMLDGDEPIAVTIEQVCRPGEDGRA